MPIGEDDQDEYSDNAFGFQLKNVHPEGAKLSKKSLQIINIVTDMEAKKESRCLRSTYCQARSRGREDLGFPVHHCMHAPPN